MSILSRIDRLIAKHGEDYLVNGTTAEKGFFRVLDSGRMHTLFDDTEIAAITRPALLVITSSDASIAINDTVARDGRTYTIKKIVVERFGGTAMVKVAALV
ncbi:MAG: hypothetical protein HYX78_09860 [Armatimonadetes bacterium]|nr:hypothetical protein [Armatimonadota bacterium]